MSADDSRAPPKIGVFAVQHVAEWCPQAGGYQSIQAEVRGVRPPPAPKGPYKQAEIVPVA